MDYARMKEGGSDVNGSILRIQRYPVQLWEQPNHKGFVVCMWVTSENTIWSYRKHLNDANELFDSVCHNFPNLPQRPLSHRTGQRPAH